MTKPNREFYNDKGAVIGWTEEVDNQLTFRKRVKESRHLMHNMDAWGIDESVLEQLRQSWCERLQVLDTENGVLYEIPFNRFEQNAVIRDFGYGRQAFVSRKFWETKRNKHKNNG